MAGKVDVQTHLADRHDVLAHAFAQWSDRDLSPTERRSVVEQYLTGADLGDPRLIGTNSILVKAPKSHPRRATVLVIGSHDVATLAGAAAAPLVSDATFLSGTGVGSTFAPTVAFAEGFAAARALTHEDPVNLSLLSIGHGDRFEKMAHSIFTGNIDAVFVTNSVVWNPHHPTITVGARGQLVAELSLTSGDPVNDFVTAGALRNPLNKLTEIVGSLRDGRGRIVLPGFYDRARAPDEGSRAALEAGGNDPNRWAAELLAARPSAALSGLERAALWPVVSVLNMSADSSDDLSTPGAASATVAFYLIPDQRHAEIEASLRAWFEDQAPADLHPAVRLVASNRPYRSPADSVPIAAQARAAYRLFGRHPVLVPAGGPAGSGEIAFATGAPVAFAGLCGPQHHYGSANEHLSRNLFDRGVAFAAETCLQLRRL